ncbi:MAG: Ig-like domain-containing protein [Chlorobiaceae bacterium]
MQIPTRITNVFLILLLWLASGCASDQPPSGGPLDTTPLQVTFSDPAPSAVNVSTKAIHLTFNHDVSLRQLLNTVIITPSIGEYDIAVHGKKAEIKGFKPLEHGRTYVLAIDKNLRDNSGRTFRAPFAMTFSTGDVIDSGIISGKVINSDCSPATNALILAFAEHQETSGAGTLLQREPDYFIQADPSGAFSFNHLAKGRYRLIAVNDRNRDLRYNAGSEESGLCGTAIIPTGSSDLLFRLSKIRRNTSKLPAMPISKRPDLAATGTISGTCFASGLYVIVEASSSTASFSTTASRDKNGLFHYSFQELPPGSYTISAFIPSGSKKPDSERQWNPGSIVPFQPAEPFGFYPEKVTVRSRWTTEHIDIRISMLK